MRAGSCDINLLGNFTIPVTPAPRGVAKVTVCLILTSMVSRMFLEERTTSVIRKITITNDKWRLSNEKVERIVQDTKRYKAEDGER